MAFRKILEITAEMENFRLERVSPNIVVPRRDSIEPVPVGTIVAMPFRVVGYKKDCDGSLMAELDNLNSTGGDTGWRPKNIGVSDTDSVILDSAEDLFKVEKKFEALRKVQERICAARCMKHEELSTSHHPDCEELRDILLDRIQ